MIDSLYDTKISVAVHRGKNGGSIVENTYAAAQCAILSGANIIEFDVARTLDNKIVVFHSFMEFRLFRTIFPVRLSPLKLLLNRPLQAGYGGNSGYMLNTLEDYLIKMKGKSILNLDRIWCADIDKCLEIIDKQNMWNQIIIKSDLKHCEKVLKAISKYNDKNVAFMAICKSEEDLNEFERLGGIYNIKISLIETLFYKEDDYLCSAKFFERAKNNNQLTWVNAIDLNKKANMCAFHGDNIAITESQDKGWGWLIERGYNIILTDWPALLSQYIKKSGKNKG